MSKDHSIAVFEDPDNEDPPLMGVLLGSFEDPPISSEDWADRMEKDEDPEVSGTWVLNTYSGAFMLMTSAGMWQGDFAELGDILEDTEGWDPHE